jgi:hypothetical protein
VTLPGRRRGKSSGWALMLRILKFLPGVQKPCAVCRVPCAVCRVPCALYPVPCTALVVVPLVRLKLSQHCQLVIIIIVLVGPGGWASRMECSFCVAHGFS